MLISCRDTGCVSLRALLTNTHQPTDRVIGADFLGLPQISVNLMFLLLKASTVCALHGCFDFDLNHGDTNSAK